MGWDVNMPIKFQQQKFSDIDLSDRFFDTLKEDYPEFSQWFQKKANDGSKALVFSDDEGLGAFIYLKPESEEIAMVERMLPQAPRMKIGTLKLADRYQGQRLGEGALGLALWSWRNSKEPEVYLTVFEKQSLFLYLLMIWWRELVISRCLIKMIYKKGITQTRIWLL